MVNIWTTERVRCRATQQTVNGAIKEPIRGNTASNNYTSIQMFAVQWETSLTGNNSQLITDNLQTSGWRCMKTHLMLSDYSL